MVDVGHVGKKRDKCAEMGALQLLCYYQKESIEHDQDKPPVAFAFLLIPLPSVHANSHTTYTSFHTSSPVRPSHLQPLLVLELKWTCRGDPKGIPSLSVDSSLS